MSEASEPSGISTVTLPSPWPSPANGWKKATRNQASRIPTSAATNAAIRRLR